MILNYEVKRYGWAEGKGELEPEEIAKLSALDGTERQAYLDELARDFAGYDDRWDFEDEVQYADVEDEE